MSHSISFTFGGGGGRQSCCDSSGAHKATLRGVGGAREQHSKAEGAKSQIGCAGVAGDSKRGSWEGGGGGWSAVRTEGMAGSPGSS